MASEVVDAVPANVIDRIIFKRKAKEVLGCWTTFYIFNILHQLNVLLAGTE